MDQQILIALVAFQCLQIGVLKVMICPDFLIVLSKRFVCNSLVSQSLPQLELSGTFFFKYKLIKINFVLENIFRLS